MFKTQIAAALFLAAITAQAQTWPWQVSLQRTINYDAGASKIYIDLPLPPAGRILTVEQVSLTVGQMTSIYGRVHQCELEAARPKIDAENALPTTRVLLPIPEWLSPTSIRTRAIVSAPVRLHVENGATFTRSPQFRLSCDADNMVAETMTVTLVGYTIPKP